MIGLKNIGGVLFMFILFCLMSFVINMKSFVVMVYLVIVIVVVFKVCLVKGVFLNGSIFWCVKCFGLVFGKISVCIMFFFFLLNGGIDIKGWINVNVFI